MKEIQDYSSLDNILTTGIILITSGENHDYTNR